MLRGTMDTKATTPNLFELRNQQVHVVYSSTGIDGKPHLSYQDPHQTLSFSGDEIRVEESEIGRLVSVSLRRTVDSGSTTLTILLPRVTLDASNSAQINTEAITTIHRFSVIPVLNHGQRDFYSVAALTGTARCVVF
jgi:hypothetical protein